MQKLVHKIYILSQQFQLVKQVTGKIQQQLVLLADHLQLLNQEQ